MVVTSGGGNDWERVREPSGCWKWANFDLVEVTWVYTCVNIHQAIHKRFVHCMCVIPEF